MGAKKRPTMLNFRHRLSKGGLDASSRREACRLSLALNSHCDGTRFDRASLVALCSNQTGEFPAPSSPLRQMIGNKGVSIKIEGNISGDAVAGLNIGKARGASSPNVLQGEPRPFFMTDRIYTNTSTCLIGQYQLPCNQRIMMMKLFD